MVYECYWQLLAVTGSYCWQLYSYLRLYSYWQLFTGSYWQLLAVLIRWYLTTGIYNYWQ